MAARHLLLFLLLVLQAWDVGAAPRQRRGLGVAGGSGDPASQLGSRADAQGDRMDVAPGRAFPASSQDSGLEPGWHSRDRQRRHETVGGKSSRQSSEVLEEILKEVDKAARGGLIPPSHLLWEEMEYQAVEKAALLGEGSAALPVSDERRGTVPATDASEMSSPGEPRNARTHEDFQNNPGADGRRNTNAADPPVARSGTKVATCIEGVLIVLGCVLWGMLMYCGTYLWMRRIK